MDFRGAEIENDGVKWRTWQVRERTVRVKTPATLPGILRSDDAIPLLREWFSRLPGDRECFVALALDVKGRPVAIQTLSQGHQTGTLVHPREVFTFAVESRAVSLILAHNHPSGDPYPSGDDDEATGRLVQGGDLLGIKVWDHIILGDEAFSYLGHGRMP